MQRHRTLAACLTALAFAVWAKPAASQSCSYQADPRLEPHEFDDPFVTALTQADALITSNALLEYQPDQNAYRLTVHPWTHKDDPAGVPWCSDKDYYGQPTSFTGGSGALVGQDLVLTVSHLFGSPPNAANCQYVRLIFAYGNFSENQWQKTCEPDSANCWVTIPAADVYECDSVVFSDTAPTPDWAVVTLDRNVTGVTPLEIRRSSQAPAQNTEMTVVGHPNHIPMKVQQDTLFDLALGEYHANGAHVLHNSSGSMVVDEGTGEIVGVVTSGGIGICQQTSGCWRESFISSAYAEMTPAYLAADYIP